MKQIKDISEEHAYFLEYVTHLSHKVQQHHDCHHLPQLVLHHLAHPLGFSLTKAAYFVDNPDFDHFIGIAGFLNEKKDALDTIWNDPHAFKPKAQCAVFHEQVRNIAQTSFKKKHIDVHTSSDVQKVAKELGIQNPQWVTWDMKHGNHGLLIFERGQTFPAWMKKMLENMAPFLGFCPL